jgi:hypothetical protein
MSRITKMIGVAVVLTGAWFWDTRSWRRKSREELVRRLQSKDWRFHKVAIKEMRRRGEDVSVFLPGLVALLIADTRVERAAAQITIKACFPDLAAEIQGYSPSADVGVCRSKAAPLLSRFPLRL